jgi:hypothetical protein
MYNLYISVFTTLYSVICWRQLINRPLVDIIHLIIQWYVLHVLYICSFSIGVTSNSKCMQAWVRVAMTNDKDSTIVFSRVEFISKMSSVLKMAYFPLFSLEMLENTFQGKLRALRCSRLYFSKKNVFKFQIPRHFFLEKYSLEHFEALDFPWNMFSSISRENKAN